MICRRRAVLIALVASVAWVAGGGAGVAHSQVIAGDGGAIDEAALFGAVAGIYGIDPALLGAIARVESSGNPVAVSPAGAEGLMQLMPATARRFGVRDPFDPVENVLGAARYLAYLSRRTDAEGARYHLPAVLAAYNAGEGAVVADEVPEAIPETRGYVRKVLLDYILDGGALADGAGGGVGRRGAAETLRGAEARGRKSDRVESRAGSDLDLLEQLAELRHERAAAAAHRGAP